MATRTLPADPDSPRVKSGKRRREAAEVEQIAPRDAAPVSTVSRPAIVAFIWGLPIVGALSCATPAPQVQPPPPVVVTTTVAPARVAVPLEFMARVESSRRVEVRTPATGIIVGREFTEGQVVRAGDVLFRIDPTLTDADRQSARARRREAESQLLDAQRRLKRMQPLLADHAVAVQDVEGASTAVERAEAALADAQGAEQRAEKSLREATVNAPVSGRIGRAMLDQGARVTGSSDVLSTIEVVSPVYLTFHPSPSEETRWLRRRNGGIAGLRVEVMHDDGSAPQASARIDYIAPVVDSRTGTREYRATFANEELQLVPGAFARVRVVGLFIDSAFVVPQRSVQPDIGRQRVLIVDQHDTVRARTVTAAEWQGGGWLVHSGLAAGERVITDGLQKAMPGRAVRPQSTPLANDSTARPQ